uniref:Ribosome recycling factor domain-containing protein n=1 Tax=Lotharella oceanica TaxID=641309 RepID=A0A7S2TSN6_9EUKA|mmetsp:Transcript_26300/g.49110  ORF Transcript_26300/g.49110 Transcript_26300/m.49110 type:complete len:291 (+) Transcript_26300:61-933(+)|eukprot:CAMPEP_0170177622 /NCGR_PEP_ID=MMETSP0040_2-20121228/10614_1 /TAXON_ID=641309 /ORGANISM="Lotharella oceanica, Strain CCMP622" /LENGTH=290 /DNA_ID=CAMNT_0010420315 /DNA_START=61 /DNA_END=933 /DNA_ORIENTATION=+
MKTATLKLISTISLLLGAAVILCSFHNSRSSRELGQQVLQMKSAKVAPSIMTPMRTTGLVQGCGKKWQTPLRKKTARQINARMHTSVAARYLRVNAAATAEGEAPDLDEKILDTEERMRKSIVALQNSLMTVSTGRANPAILDRVQVNYYGTPTPLRSLAGVSTPNAQEIIVDPYDKSALGDVEKAIFQANLGLTPSNDGKVIRLLVPMLTTDRRKELAKGVKKFGEEAKVAIRNIRRDTVDFVKKTEKNKLISEDDSKYYQAETQKVTDKVVKEVDAMIARKEKDLTEM